MLKHFLYGIGFLVLLISCKQSDHSNKTPQVRGLIAENAIVVSARAEASKIGLSMLKKGGNAFDAMVATELALAVAYPYAGNLGGGGFMVYRMNTGEIGGIDYREKAPLTASKNMYLDSLGNVIPNKSTLGALAVGIPGTVAGVFEVHKKFGTLPIDTILDPIIALAYKGVVITKKQEKRIKKYQPIIKIVSGDSILFSQLWKEKDTIKYVQLAKTLERIKKFGKDGFYKGETAKIFTNFIQDNGGIITLEDLEKYKPQWREPIVFSYDDLKVISMSPPSSGGVCLGQIMKMIEPFDLQEYGHNTLKSIQVITEAERRAYADRSYYLGDPDFVEIPTETLLDKEYLTDRMKDFSFEKATPSTAISNGAIEVVESDETTHYSIVDQFGNAIAATTTLNGAYGSKLFCPELGFFFNNEMDDFSSKPGVPNMFGLIGAEANSIAPEKRMLSSMTPTIVEKDGELFMSVGTPGGSTIITSVLQTILNVHEYNMTMQDAVNSPRFHHQWLPDEIRIEPNLFEKNLLKSLEQKGYNLNEKRTPVIGKVDGILVLKDKKLEGGADYRGDDTAVGF